MAEQKKIYIGNLDYKVTKEDLDAEFKQYGEIAESVLITESGTGRSKGFGFVTFKKEEDAAKAVKGADGQKLKGFDRELRVNIARERERTGGGNRGGARKSW